MSLKHEYKNWDIVISKLIKKYPELTNADLIWRHGTMGDLLDQIANKLGKTTNELLDEIK